MKAIGSPLIFLIVICFFISVTLSQICSSAREERCICTTTPYCPCSSITATSSLNFSSNYNSHLVLLSSQGCRPCPSSCSRCSSVTICTQCFTSFSLVNGTCSICPINCQSCTNGVCLSCNNQYYKDNQMNCQPCSVEGVNICTGDTIASCLNNYFLDNNAANCIQCDPNCLICSSTSRCSSCSNGFFLNSSSKCTPCMRQCSSCLTAITCSACNNSTLYFNVSLGLCSSGFDVNCLIFLNSTSCLRCRSSFYLGLNRTCFALEIGQKAANCMIYQQSSMGVVCIGCSGDYYQYVGNSECKLGCSIACLSCIGPHYGLCLSCQPNFYLLNLNCIPIVNLNGGAAFQRLYTSFNEPTFFQESLLLLSSSCIPEATMSGNPIKFQLVSLQSYSITLKWKIYVLGISNLSIVNYRLSLTNLQNNTFSYDHSINPSTCFANCNGSFSACLDKSTSSFSGMLTNSNLLRFSTDLSLQLAISQILVIAFRCGGVQGQQCLECISTSTCTKCLNPNYFILASTCVIQCPSNYYVHLARMTCYEACPLGTYSVDLNQQCYDCQYPCSTCSSSNQCLTCSDGTYFNSLNSQCNETCPPSYFMNMPRAACQQCVFPCWQCVDNLRCLSCTSGFYESGTMTCTEQCDFLWYGNLETLSCVRCVAPCEGCSTKSNCLSCLDGSFLLGSECFQTCPIGYYSNSSTKSCLVCDSTCHQCASSPTNCVSCFLGTFLSNFTCISTCPASFYADEYSLTCASCPTQCLTCSSYQVCSECALNFHFFAANSSCLVRCPTQFYDLAFTCKTCQSPCYQCFGNANNCTSCSNLFFWNGSCFSQCPSNTFVSTFNMSCIPCSSQCLECEESSNICTKCHKNETLLDGLCSSTCVSGWYLSNISSCIQCLFPCLSCINSTFCQECPQPYLTFEGKCLLNCPTGFVQYPQNSTVETIICEVCPKDCLACSSITNSDLIKCTSCSNGFWLSNNSCLNSCQIYEYQSDQQNNCLKCEAPCFTCLSSEICLSCLFGFYWKGTCVNECPSSFFLKLTSNACWACDSKCLECSIQPDNCTVCASSFVLQVIFSNSTFMTGFKCLSKCYSGFYIVSVDNQCYSCLNICLTCDGSRQNCTSCRDQTLILFNNACLLSCPISFFETNNSCISCPLECSSCVKLQICSSCVDGYSLDGEKCWKSCSPQKFEMNQKCLDCSYPCASCQSSTQCLSCLRGYLYKYSCLLSCPRTTFADLSSMTCMPCRSNCSFCSSLNKCLRCQAGVLVYGLCQDRCPIGFYQSFSLCLQCPYECRQCLDAYTCLNCTSGFLVQGICSSFCPLGTVAIGNASIKVCKNCIVNCIQCAISEDQCLQCSNGYYLYLSICLLGCPNGTFVNALLKTCQSCKFPCLSCANAYSCLSCIEGYMLYKQSGGNQCISGKQCPNSYYLNLQENMCEASCEFPLRVQPLRRTCSIECPPEFVFYQLNSSCLMSCPTPLWINSNLDCTNDTIPPQLPYFQCRYFSLRNLLIIPCNFSEPIANINALQTNSFTVSMPSSGMNNLKIMNGQTIYLLVTLPDDTSLKQEYIAIKLTNRYTLFSMASSSNSTLVNRRLTKTTSYPLQNINTSIFISNYCSYSFSQRQTGLQLAQISKSISIVALIFSLLCLITNVNLTSVIFINSLQWMFTLSLLDVTYSPNFQQFLEGFKLSFLILDVNSSLQESNILWSIDNRYTSNLWKTVDIFNFQIISLPSVALYLLFAIIFVFSYFIFKGYEHSIEESKRNISLKAKIIYNRFYYNYLFQLLLLAVFPSSIAIFAQIIRSNALTFSTSLFIFLFQCLVLGICIKNYFEIPKVSATSKYFFMTLIESSFISGLSVWSNLQIYCGACLMISVINLYSFTFIFHRKSQKNDRNFFQVIEWMRISLLILVIVFSIKQKDWDCSTMYVYSWGLVLMALLFIISIAFHSSQIFLKQEKNHPEKQPTCIQKNDNNRNDQAQNKSQKRSEKLESNISNEEKLINKHIFFKRESQKSESFQEEKADQMPFFSNKDASIQSDSDSSIDLIDFDENKGSKTPQILLRIDKNLKEQ